MVPEMKNKPFLVGLTGNFGTGKSTVADFFRELGARVVSADQLAHEIFKKENRLHPRLKALFPELNGNLDRTRIARIVFRNGRKRKALESLIHPYVFDRIQEEIRRAKKRIVILEIPLLFESGFYRRCDLNIVVQTAARKALDRLRQRGFPKGEVEARWRVQMPPQKKAERADFLIDNSNGLKNTQHQVASIWKLLQKIERSLARNAKGKN